IPPGDFHKTVFLAVEMERQEVDAGGKPMGPPTTLPTIAQWRQNQPAPAFPPEGSPRELAGQYLQWASANTADILQPLYYVIAKGDQWQKPGAQPVGLAVFDPNQYLTGEIPANLTNE